MDESLPNIDLTRKFPLGACAQHLTIDWLQGLWESSELRLTLVLCDEVGRFILNHSASKSHIDNWTWANLVSNIPELLHGHSHETLSVTEEGHHISAKSFLLCAHAWEPALLMDPLWPRCSHPYKLQSPVRRWAMHRGGKPTSTLCRLSSTKAVHQHCFWISYFSHCYSKMPGKAAQEGFIWGDIWRHRSLWWGRHGWEGASRVLAVTVEPGGSWSYCVPSQDAERWVLVLGSHSP